MPRTKGIPSLTFPLLPVGPLETVPDLTRLLYNGGAALRLDQVSSAIKAGRLGPVLLERFGLVEAIHEFINQKLVGGGSTETASNQIDETVRFFAFAERSELPLTVDTVEEVYLDYAEHLYQRFKVAKTINQNTAYQTGLRVAQILDAVLGRQKSLVVMSPEVV